MKLFSNRSKYQSTKKNYQTMTINNAREIYIAIQVQYVLLSWPPDVSTGEGGRCPQVNKFEEVFSDDKQDGICQGYSD